MHYYDSHCHFSPEITLEEYKEKLHQLLVAQQWPINLMMTNHIDEEIILDAISEKSITSNKNVTFNVGIHPWFTHLYTFEEKSHDESEATFKQRHYESVLEKYSNNSRYQNENISQILPHLPYPRSATETILKFASILEEHVVDDRCNVNIGEIGVDKFARIPKCGYLGNTIVEQPTNDTSAGKLTNYKVKLDHQLLIFKLQLNLAMKYKYAKSSLSVSIHCVGAHGHVYNCLKELDGSYLPKVVMHSYSGSLDNAKMLCLLRNLIVWFGFSDVVNLINVTRTSLNGHEKLEALIKYLSDRILVETDLGIDRMLENHDKYVQDVANKLVFLGLTSEQLATNWKTFCSS